MKDKIYKKLADQLNDVYAVEPNDLRYANATNVFKAVTAHFKFFPFRFIIPLSLVATILLYIVLGVFIVRLVSILQYGF